MRWVRSTVALSRPSSRSEKPWKTRETSSRCMTAPTFSLVCSNSCPEKPRMGSTCSETLRISPERLYMLTSLDG